jgi:hypothetical protein
MPGYEEVDAWGDSVAWQCRPDVHTFLISFYSLGSANVLVNLGALSLHYVSIRQHTPAYVSIRQHTHSELLTEVGALLERVARAGPICTQHRCILMYTNSLTPTVY